MNKSYFDIPKAEIKREHLLLTVRPATQADVEATTKLIQAAYSYWVKNGVVVSPATQTEEKTASHLLNGRGFVAVNETGEIKGTFSLDEIELSDNTSEIFAKYKSDSSTINYRKSASDTSSLHAGIYLEFKKLAVAPELLKQGIGQEIYKIAENLGKVINYQGMALETVKEAKWLYEWYLKLGYSIAGKYKYGSSSLETLLLVNNQLNGDIK